MTSFAESGDLASRWRTLSTEEAARAEVLLGDASVWLRAWFPDLDARLTSGALDATIPVMVVCSMVKRAMLDSDGLSAEQSQQTAGPFMDLVQRSFSNPDGNLYLTSREEQLIRGFPACAISMTAPGL